MIAGRAAGRADGGAAPHAGVTIFVLVDGRVQPVYKQTGVDVLTAVAPRYGGETLPSSGF